MLPAANSVREPETEKDVQLASFLAKYADCLADHPDDRGLAKAMLESHRELVAELAAEVGAIHELQSLLEPEEVRECYGDYHILRELGRGGMGIVYEAVQASLDRVVALKILPPGLLLDSRAVSRFRRGAQAAARLTHPNIVGVYAMGVSEGTPYIAMEYAQGDTLQRVLQVIRDDAKDMVLAGRNLPRCIPRNNLIRLSSVLSPCEEATRTEAPRYDAVGNALAENAAANAGTPRDVKGSEPAIPLDALNKSYCLQVASAFAAVADGVSVIHANEIIHRDLKPSNLIVDPSGKIRIIDFGLAFIEGQDTLTQTLERVGTPLYMSPEQASGRVQLTRGSDIYSLGVILYELLTLRPPFHGRQPQEILWRIENEDPRPPRSHNAYVPRDLQKIVLKCLRKEHSRRYATAEALAQDLRRFVRSEPVEAEEETRLEWALRKAKRSWRITAKYAAALALMAILVFGANLYLEGRERREASKNSEYQALVSRNTVSPTLPMSDENITLLEPRSILVAFDADAARMSDLPDGSQQHLYGTFRVGFAAGPVLVDSKSTLRRTLEKLNEAARLAPERPEAHYQIARGLVLLNEDDAALEHLSVPVRSGFVPGLALRAAILDGREGAPQAREELAEKVGDAETAGIWIDIERGWIRQDPTLARNAYDRLTAKLSDRSAGHIQNELLVWRAREQLASNEPDRAIDLIADLARLAAETPGQLEPRILLSRAYHVLRNDELAEESFLTFHAGLEPTARSEAAEMIAAAYTDMGELDLALAWADKMDAGPARSCRRSHILSFQGKDDAAVSAAREALELEGSTCRALLSLANALYRKGSIEDARHRYEGARSACVEDGLPLLGIGACFELAGDLAGARAAYEQASDSDPRKHYNIGRILARENQLEKAKSSYDRAIQLDPRSAPALLNRGIVLDELNRPGEAMEDYGRAVELAPRFGVAHYNLGWAYQRQRDYARAETELAMAIETGFKEAVAYANLGTCMQYQWKLGPAIENFDRAIQLDPARADTYESKATACYWMGDFRRAAEAYRKVLDLDRERPRLEATNELGDCLALLGQFEEAVATYDEVSRMDPEFIYAHNSRSEILLKTRLFAPPEGADLERAIATLEDIARLPNAAPSIVTLLDEYRAALEPRLVSYASVDARLPAWVPLVKQGAEWVFLLGVAVTPAGLEWTGVEFDSASWKSGRGGFGTRGAQGARTHLEGMPGQWSALYLRHHFTVSDPSRFEALTLRIRSDDAYVVYLNGKEVVRAGVGSPGIPVPPAAVTDDPEYASAPWAWIEHRFAPEILESGDNVLALQGVSGSLEEDADFCLDAALLGKPRFDAEAREKAWETLEAFRQAAVPEDEPRLEYFEGRLHQLAGDPASALSKYERVRTLDPSRPEPIERAAECLVVRGDAIAADRLLGHALRSGLERHSGLWEAWFRLHAVDSMEEPEEILAAMPPVPPGGHSQSPHFAGDLRWLLEQLGSEGAIRINCGGAAYVDGKRRVWSHDRFWRYGRIFYLFRMDDLKADPPDRPLYQNERFFQEYVQPIEGYRIPLPNGCYRVTLHFIEGHDVKERVFDVLVQGKVFLKGYDPGKKGFGKPDVYSIERVDITDGSLRIDFVRRTQNPKINAIEIERL